MQIPNVLLIILLCLFSLMFSTGKSFAQLTCVEANGLNWCYNNQECGQACNDVCASGGMQPIADNQVWFEAQNTEEKCIAISEAFGLGNTVNFFDYGLACLEDTPIAPHGADLNPPLFCSSEASCPELHRTDMDQLGIPCESNGSRRSICPCEPIPPSQVPTLSEWGFIAMAGILGIVGFMVIRKRKVTA